MNGAPPPSKVPILTEVVHWPQVEAPMNPPAMAPATPPSETMLTESVAVDIPVPMAPSSPPQLRMPEEQIIEGVLIEVQRQVELMLEYRIRETLTPVLSRAADHIVREARAELASTLRDVVARAVAQELSRHRTR